MAKMAPCVIKCNEILATEREKGYLCTVRTTNRMLNNLKLNARMKKLLLMSMAVFCLMTVSAQKTVVSQKSQKVFDVVEQMPEYPGGTAALYEYLMENVKYPEDAEKQKVEGRVIASFVVETDGSITDVNAVKQVFPSLDREAVRLLEAMPKWVPGKQNGKVVRVRYTVPVVFKLK